MTYYVNCGDPACKHAEFHHNVRPNKTCGVAGCSCQKFVKVNTELDKPVPSGTQDDNIKGEDYATFRTKMPQLPESGMDELREGRQRPADKLAHPVLGMRDDSGTPLHASRSDTSKATVGTQDKREREIRQAMQDGALMLPTCDVNLLLSLLDAERKRVQELEGGLRRLINCPAMIYTSFSGNPDIEQRVHKQCICCTAHKGHPHIEGCHITEAESLLSKEQKK